MTLILSNAIVHLGPAHTIYCMNDSLWIEYGTSAIRIDNIPENALQQIAVAETEGQKFLEMDDASLYLGGGNEAA